MQKLGKISSGEVAELNSVFGGKYLVKTAGSGGNQKLVAYNVPVLGGAAALGGGLGFYAKFVKGYSIIWLVGGFAPFLTSLVYNKSQ